LLKETLIDPAGRQWLLFRKKLDKAGVTSSAAMTPRELRLLATGQLQGEAAEISRISGLYRDIRYAPDGPQVSELETAVKQFRPAKKAQ